MSEPVVISPNAATSRHTTHTLVLAMLCIIAGTFLRVSLLVIYPVLVFVVIYLFRFRFSASLIIMLGLAVLSLLASFYPHLFLRYKLMSLYYVIPFLILLFAEPVRTGERYSLLKLFMTCLAGVAAFNNVIGVFQVIANPMYDDSFQGIYSEYSLSLNGLMLINAILFFYYFVNFLETRRFFYFVLLTFFAISATLGFYGAGLVICTIAFILTFLHISPASLIKTTSIGIVAVAMVYLLLRLLNPVVLEYNLANIRKLTSLDVQYGPRKLISFYNYGISYPKNAKDFLLGSGPGTYVSRSAFIVGSPDYAASLQFVKDDDQPYYFKNYAYTLWNKENTSRALYLDGFRNQPFSSVLALLGEYGFLFFSVFCILYGGYIQKVRRLFKQHGTTGDLLPTYRFFKFLVLLLPLLLLIDNFLEYPEVMLILLPAIKFAHADIKNEIALNEKR